MRIVRFLDDRNQVQWGCDFRAGTAQPLDGSPLHGGRPDAVSGRVAVRKLLAPAEPPAILCIGLNYRQHALETHAPLPERPVLFMKNPAALAHPGDPIRLPPSCLNPPQVDYEVELAVVLGRAALNVPRERALDYVLGYTIANDVSARLWQKQGGAGQWIRGKSFDTFCPIGPELVTADEIPDPQTLALTTRVNGERLQDGHTSDMVFPVAELIATLSQGMTLLPGTLLLTGTPAGVGVARQPPRFLLPGDRVTLEIERIGVLENPVEAVAADAPGAAAPAADGELWGR
jgi:2-keto-4-pentenoate hydratase/2-oxohepta-3-ene-1,7-dioic acid hydratase in catechol pathway